MFPVIVLISYSKLISEFIGLCRDDLKVLEVYSSTFKLISGIFMYIYHCKKKNYEL